MLLLLQVCFVCLFFVREISCCLFFYKNQADAIEAFNSASRYLVDLLNIDNPYFEQRVGQIYTTELQLNKSNFLDTEAPFLDLDLSITNCIVSSKICDKRDEFNFEIHVVNFPFIDRDVLRPPPPPFPWCIYLQQIILCENIF